MYLAKYAHQDATRLENEPTVKLRSWANRIEEIMAEEQENAEKRR